MNLPEGFVLDEKKTTGIAELPEGFVLDSDEEVGFSELPEGFIPEKELNKDVNALKQMKASGQQLTRDQERVLWDADEAKPLSQKASEAVTTFFPAAIDTAKQLGTGAGEFIYKGILKPIDAMSQSPEEAEKTLKEAGNVIRSGVHGVAQDVQETADAAVRFAMFGSSITDKLLGRSDDERFERYMLREGMRQFSQKVYEDNPDAAARLLAENPLLQKLAYAAALAQGGTAEEAEAAKKSYEELVKESGLTKEEINENVALLGEVISPLSLPGTNTATKFLNKGTSKVVQKTGELALKGIVAPLAKGTEKTAGAIVSGIEGVEKLSRKIGEYTIGDPDTLIKTATTTALSPAKIPARMTRGIARTVSDVAGQAKGVGGAAGRRGLFERAGRDAAAGDLTKKLFGPESLGGKGRARAADWAVRQSNAIVQPAVNGAVLNIAMGLPDIETATDLGYMAGVGAGIGAYGGARLQDRAFALVDPTTSLAQKIDTVLTPDPEGLRRDQDADIERFVATADASLLENISNLSNLDNIKSALDLKIKNLESKKAAQIRDEDANRIQAEIDNYKDQRKSLDKSTPETQAEIKRQIQLSFADAMDLAKTTGAAAGLNNVQVKILNPDQVEGFYRDLYGKTLTDAESVVKQLVGNPNLTEQESAMLKMADETIKQYFADVAGSTTARGFAISESSARPEHLRYANQKGATVVINGDLLAQMSRDGLNLGRVINHEMQHALSNFDEVRQMLAPLRKQLFDQKIQNPDGTFEVVSNGAISDQQLDEYAMQYAAGMDASGGASFLGQFANMDQVRAYMKEEVLSELAGLSGASHGDLRSSLDSAGRQVVDWLEVKSQNGALKKIKEGLRRFGVLVDDQGQFSTVLGAQLTPESLAAMRQYQRKLRDLNESMVYNSDPRKDAPEITFTQIATNRVLQERYKHSDFFAQEQVVTLTTPDGKTQEIVVPPGAKVDSFVSDYRFQNGQLVDEDGNPVSLGPDIPLQAMPDGTAVTIDTRVARNADGSPQILSPRETKRRARKRGEAIRKAIDDAPDDGSGLRLEDTGNGNYRGTLSPTQIAAINALPNDLVAPSLKRKIAFFNDILGRKDGSIVEIEYQAALRDGKYRALQPQLRTEIPIGFQFDKQGNFLMTTMSMSRMHDKANAWAAKRPRNLRLWGGDMTKFWDSVRQYLTNHKAGLQGHIGLHPDPEVAMQMKNRINDLFNVYRKETREANPERTTLPKRRGQDSKDVVIRSRRMDRINSYDETALPKMPFQYELAVQNYLPAENPLADFQTPQDFAKNTDAEESLIVAAVNGNVEPLELQLHEQDFLRPAEYIDVQDGKLRVRSMFDPTQPVFEPEESDSEVPAMLSVQFMPAEVEAPSGERGFKSKLQTEIQRKFKGANATPEQLKSVLGNPQNVKPEEVKWSGVMDEIDRLAQENKGKVPVQELLNYLRDEGQVKFEEVTLGGVDRMTAPRSAERLRQVLISNGYNTAEADSVVQAASRKENAYTGRNGGIIDLVQEVISDYRGLEEERNGTTKYAQYQLPGGENYREVVLSMPSDLSRSQAKIDAINKRRQEILDTAKEQDLFKRSQTDPEAKALNDSLTAEFVELGKQADQLNADIREGKTGEQFTSSHFPDIPNYIAHMRVNERTDAEGNEGLFVEEFQSDRHQQGREKGYQYTDTQGWSAVPSKKIGSLQIWEVFDSSGKKIIDGIAAYNEAEAIETVLNRDKMMGAVPDAPFRKDWGVQLFKRALRDAVESGKKWIGWTTGIEQVKRYEDAFRQAVDEISWTTPKGYPKAFGAIKNGRTVLAGKINDDGTVYDSSAADANGKQLNEVVGNEIAAKILSENSGTATGNDLTVGGEGMKGFYDQILLKEIGKYVAKMGGKVEKSIINKNPLSDRPNTFYTNPETGELEKMPQGNPIWRVNITPEMENVVRAGQIQFMPAEAEGAMPAEQQQGMEGVEAPQTYRRISDMIPPLQGVELPEAIAKGAGEFGILRQALQGVEAPIREPAKVPEIPKQQVEVKQEIPVAKTEADAEEEVADAELRSTGIDVPESVDEQSVISNAIKIANSQPWKKGRDFKMDLQRRVLEAAEKAGVVISERTAEAIEYLARVGFKDALIALEQNPNAIGWYDEKTKQALGVMSLLFPEIATDENARFAFTWALAVTSNGLKVDKNFELAERVYRQYRKTGKMPTNIEAGQAQKAINEGLDLFNKLTKEWGMENTRKFMQTDFTVGEISRLSKDLSPGGEFADTNVRGSAILGPKIGNGFFSNLYGLFDALTMDRWLVRTWGRWTGTLVELNPELTKQATDRLQEAVQKLTPEDKKRMDEMIKQDISQMSIEDLSMAIQKASMKPELRQLMNQTETGEEFRKSGNGLAKYLDGQKEAPSGPTERNFIREIFGLMLDELKSDPKYAGLTMADLQAVLWYAEKRLYETAKVKADEDSLDSSDADGYEDDEAPDYANAAIGVARKKGVSQKRIDEVLEKIKNERTATTRPEAQEGDSDQARQQEGAGGFTGKEKQKFRQYVAVTTARRNRTGNEKALWTYARRGGSDSGDAGVLKPRSKKNLGVKYVSEWKPGRKLATMYRNNGLPPVKFLELDSTDKASAQKFADTLQQSKDASSHGAAVYVYPVEEYQGMKLFLSESGKSGFALKPDGDIVSVFSMDKGSGRSIMETAISAGGKKLDAFDTVLPEFYGTHGFVEAARIPWNDEFAPEGWDKQTFMKFNNGEPDVVMMVLDPKFEGEYEPRTDIYATDYDQAVEMQDSLLKKLNKGSKKK